MPSVACIPQDDQLPQLVKAVDVHVMKSQLQAALFSTAEQQERYHIQHCEILQARYKPGRYCMVSYSLTIEDRHLNKVQEQIVTARFFPFRGSPTRFEKAKKADCVSPKLGSPLFHVSELEMVAWTFPNDRKLQFLADLVSDQLLKDMVIPRLVGEYFGSKWQIQNLQQQLVHYVAEHTCTTKVDVKLTHGETNEETTLLVFGKTYYNKEGLQAYQNMSQLWNSSARQNGEFHMAQPLWYDEAHYTLWQRGLVGLTLSHYSIHSSEMLQLMKGAAANVATLHQCRLSCPRSVGLEELVQGINRAQKILGDIKPEFQDLLTKIASMLHDHCRHLDTQHIATLHGDLHLKNFISNFEVVALIDLDNLCAGFPLKDIGSFLASLYYRGMLEDVSFQEMQPTVNAFVQTYVERVPWPVRATDLAWHTAVALLVDRGVRSLTRLKSGRLDRVKDLLVLTEQVICNHEMVCLKR